MNRVLIIMILIASVFNVEIIFAQDESNNVKIKIIQLAPDLYKFTIGAVNIAASIGKDGVLLSDAAYESSGDQLLSELKKLGTENIKYIINTHWHSDHVGGNITFGKKAIIIAHCNVRKLLSKDVVLSFWNEEHKARPEYTRPDIAFSGNLTIYFNGEEVEITHLPNGHTNGDAIVYFKNANVLHMGDLLFSDGFPAIDFENGGNVEQFAKNLQKVIEIMPEDVKIIAGHGPDYTIEKLKKYKNMLLSTLEIVLKEMKKGNTPEEMKKIKSLKVGKSGEKDFLPVMNG